LENKIVYNFYNKVLKKSKKLTIKDESKINQELVSFLLKYKEFLKNNYKKEHKRQIIKSYKDNKLTLCWEKFRNEIYINKNLKTYKHDTSYDVKTRTVYINDNSYKVPYYMILNYDNKTLFEKYLNCIINNVIYKPKYNTTSEYLSVSKDIYNDIKYLEAYYCNYYSKCKISIQSINKGSYLLIRCKKNNEIFTYKIKEYKNRILFIENKTTISKENFRIQFKTMMENDIRKYLYK
jgi:K+ transporter